MTFAEALDKYFKITERGSTIHTELRAGLTSFLTLSYILLVHPQVLARAGLEARDVVTATCLSSGLATALVGLMGNLPFAMAPGLGLSAYFTYGVVMAKGGGMTWQQGLACVMLSGLVVCLLTITLMVEWSMKYVPNYLKTATIVGIGLLLAGIGFESSGLIVKGEVGDLYARESWKVWLCMAGLMSTAIMKHHDVKGAIVIGVTATTVVYWTWENDWPTTVAELPALNQTWMQVNMTNMEPSSSVPAVTTFLLVSLFDCSGCIIAMAMQCGVVSDLSTPVPGGSWALLACGLGTVVAGMTGCSPIIIAIEGMAGILDGGRTGLTALTVSGLFFLAIFFAPLFGSVPECASAGVLMMIGSFMMAGVKELDWNDIRVSLPSFLVILMMPLSHSISNGIWFGGGAALLFYLCSVETWRSWQAALCGRATAAREDGVVLGKKLNGTGNGDVHMAPGSKGSWGADRRSFESDPSELQGLLVEDANGNGSHHLANNAWE